MHVRYDFFERGEREWIPAVWVVLHGDLRCVLVCV